jgi:glutamyl-tRNA synthetase
VEYEAAAIEKHLSSPGLKAQIDALSAAILRVEPFTEAAVETTLRDTAAACGVKAGALIHATRVAVTGRMNSPGLFEVLVVLGRDRTLARLAQLSSFLAARESS